VEEDMVGTMDKIKGGIKDVIGKVTRDKRTQVEGRAEMAKGRIKDTAQRTNDGTKANAPRWPSDDVT
jgi:uncharacterized protein YjbJ (UPF0337 family)